MILVLDNRDSFTFNLAQALAALGARVRVLRADAVTAGEVERMRPERILVGPGPGPPERAGSSAEVIRRLSTRVPVLGVCLGHQALGWAFGARIARAAEPLHGYAVPVDHDGRGVFAHLPRPLPCTRYNSLTVVEEGLPACLEVSARSADGEVMGLRHKELPLEGVQFHPESVLSVGGDALLANFLAS